MALPWQSTKRVNSQSTAGLRSNKSTISYRGAITAYLRHAVFEMDGQVKLLLYHFHHPSKGRGLRVGAILELYNVHPVFSKQNKLKVTSFGRRFTLTNIRRLDVATTAHWSSRPFPQEETVLGLLRSWVPYVSTGNTSGSMISDGTLPIPPRSCEDLWFACLVIDS